MLGSLEMSSVRKTGCIATAKTSLRATVAGCDQTMIGVGADRLFAAVDVSYLDNPVLAASRFFALLCRYCESLRI